MNARLLTAVAAAGAVALAVPAGAAPKKITKSYDVTLPVPFPVDESVPDMTGCINGQETATRNTTVITLPATGTLSVKVDFEGDWDLYLLDSKGSTVAASENFQPTGSVDPAQEKLTWKKAKKGQQVSIVVCNWLGLPDATVSYTLTYAK